MGKPQRPFGKDFETEAVRLVEPNGRTQREIAEIPSAAIRRPTSSARFSSRSWQRKLQNALHNRGASPSPPIQLLIDSAVQCRRRGDFVRGRSAALVKRSFPESSPRAPQSILAIGWIQRCASNRISAAGTEYTAGISS